jgi:hypothetical protein
MFDVVAYAKGCGGVTYTALWNNVVAFTPSE